MQNILNFQRQQLEPTDAGNDKTRNDIILEQPAWAENYTSTGNQSNANSSPEGGGPHQQSQRALDAGNRQPMVSHHRLEVLGESPSTSAKDLDRTDRNQQRALVSFGQSNK